MPSVSRRFCQSVVDLMKTAKPDTKPYGYAYKDAVIEAGQIIGLKGGPLGVLKSLVFFCNGSSGQAYPSKLTISGHSGISLRTVKTHLRALEGIGIIKGLAYTTGGHGRATVYTFGLPQWSCPRFQSADAKGAKFALLEELKGANFATYSAKFARYSANFAHQQREHKNKKGIKDDAGRVGEGPRLRGVTFTELCRRQGMSYREALGIWEGYKAEAQAPQ
jgi:hypothetical protein